MRARVLRFTVAIAAVVGTVHASEWLQWRGADGQGHAVAHHLPLHWSSSENVLWQTPITGRGWSSPVVEGNTIWLTTAVETEAAPEDIARRTRPGTPDQPMSMLERLQLFAVAVDRESGRATATVPLFDIREPQAIHKLNSFASPSPVIAGGKLYCHFGTFGTACVDLKTRGVVWRSDDLHIQHETGPGSSPVVWGDLLVFNMDGSDAQFVAALNRHTGKLAWQTARSGAMNPDGQKRKSFGTPIVITANGREQLISPASDWVYSLDENGRELWKVPYGQLGFSVTPRPVYGHGMLYLATGFGRKQVLAIQVEGVSAPAVRWRATKGIPTMPSPLLVGNELYLVDDGGFITCLDARTGAEHYRERLGGNFSSSPLFADERILICNREGDCIVLKPGTTFAIEARNTIGAGVYASPIALGKELYIRTESALLRIETPPAP